MKRALLVFLLCLSLLGMSVASNAEYFDFDGAQITIVGGGRRFIEGTGATATGTAYGLHKEAEELFNCKIEFYGGVGFNELIPLYMTRLLSGDAEYDIWPVDSHRFWGLVGQGALFPVDLILPPEYFQALPGLAGAGSEFMSLGGHRYTVGTVGGTLSGMVCVIYSPQVFADLGLPDLQELYLKGEWTWDAMADIARQAAADTTGDGQTDRYGIRGLGRPTVLYPFIYSYHQAALAKEVDGRMMFTGTEPEFLEAVHVVLEWIREGIASPSAETGAVFDIPSQRAVMAVSDVNGAVQIPDYDYRIVPIPRAPGMQEHIHASIFLWGQFALPANVRYPEGMVQLIDFLYPYDHYQLANEEYINRVAKDRTTARILWDMLENSSGYCQRMTQRGDGLWPAIEGLNAALGGRVPLATAMSEVAGAVQANLDAFYNQ